MGIMSSPPRNWLGEGAREGQGGPAAPSLGTAIIQATRTQQKGPHSLSQARACSEELTGSICPRPAPCCPFASVRGQKTFASLPCAQRHSLTSVPTHLTHTWEPGGSGGTQGFSTKQKVPPSVGTIERHEVRPWGPFFSSFPRCY